MRRANICIVQFRYQQRDTRLHLLPGSVQRTKMNVLLQILLFHQCRLQKGNNFSCCYILVHDLFEHTVFDAEKKNDGALICQIILMDTVFINKDKIVKAVSLSKSRNESTQRMIPTVENNKTVIQSKEIRKNDNKVRMIFRQKKKKQERNSFSQTALTKKNILNENSTKNIMPLPQSLSSQREKENIKLPDMKEFGELNTQLERYRCLKQIYKEKKSTLDFRKTVSNFKYMELSSLKDLLERKKRKFNLKCLHDAFINPIEASQPTFYLPKGGCGLLSKPEYLD